MSASSNCVTCGIITQLRARLAPEIFLIRDSGFVSTGPNFAKSTVGHGSRLSAPPPVPRRRRAPPRRPSRPSRTAARPPAGCGRSVRCPSRCARSTPSSRANLRTDGDACAAVNAGLVHRRSRDDGRTRGGGSRRRRGRRRRCGRCDGRSGGGRRNRVRGAGGRRRARLAAAACSSVSTSVPSLTLSPTFRLHFAHHAGRRRGHVHRRLVGLERDQRIVGLHACRPASRTPRSPGCP